jgi:hypothetical protein
MREAFQVPSSKFQEKEHSGISPAMCNSWKFLFQNSQQPRKPGRELPDQLKPDTIALAGFLGVLVVSLLISVHRDTVRGIPFVAHSCVRFG